MKVHIPTPLRAYTHANPVDADGATLDQVIADLDRRYPGLRFRIVNEQDKLREHIQVFINQRVALDLTEAVQGDDHIHIIAAISGGAGGTSLEPIRD